MKPARVAVRLGRLAIASSRLLDDMGGRCPSYRDDRHYNCLLCHARIGSPHVEDCAWQTWVTAVQDHEE